MFTKEDVYYVKSDPAALAAKLNGLAKVKVINGAASGDVALDTNVQSVIAVLAVTAATGAVATKFLLAPTTDYTLKNASVLTMNTTQVANKLIVIYN